MIRELLSHSPVLVLPLLALCLFVVVFVGVVIHVIAKKKEDVDSMARLPMAQEDVR